MKLFHKAALMISVVCLCLGTFGGCIKEKYDPQAIQVSVAKLGYGTEWLHAIAEAYTQKTGVNVQITEEIGREGNTKIETEIESLVSKIDIAIIEAANFGKNIYNGSVSVGGVQYDCLYANLTDVYRDESAGKENTIEKRMKEDLRNLLEIDGKYYSLPWQGGVIGIVRNNAKWKELGFTDEDEPLTSNQLFEICDEIVAKQSAVSPFIYCAEDEYYTMFAPLWFAQYDGEAALDLFMSGRDPEGNYSEYLYSYDGQAAALRAMQQLITGEGYQDTASLSLDFSDMQAYFLNGRAVFCVNGSWLEIEMNNYTGADIGYVRTPVISEIVERATSVKEVASAKGTDPDDVLADIIREIDAGKTKSNYDGILQSDFDIIKEARENSYLAAGANSTVIIPAYSSKVKEAKEFLKFMYSDEGLNIYYKTLNGATLPISPSNGYDSDVELSPFRASINEAENNGYLFRYSTATSKMFCLGGVDAYFRNGCGSIVSEFRKGSTVENIISFNISNIKSRWNVISRYL